MNKSAILLLLLPVLMIFLTNQQTSSAFSGGSGTPDDPYIITTVEELQAMKDNLSAYYALGNDIDASDTQNWNGGLGFIPVGSTTAPFRGGFDGRGYKITGLFINRPTENYVGLFGVVDNRVVIRNVVMENENVTGYSRVGGIAGILRGNAVIENCSVSGRVAGSYVYVGGLVGGSNGSIIRSSSSADVYGSTYAGGLVGASAGSIIDSHFTGNVSGSTYVGGIAGLSSNEVFASWTAGIVTGVNYVGGLVGWIYSGIVVDSYSLAEVQGTGYVGGLAGMNHGYVINTYSAGQVSGSSNVGGLIGFTGALPVENFVRNSFWDNENSGQTTSSGGTAKSTAEMMDVRTYTDVNWSAGLLWPWDFENNPHDDRGTRDRWSINGGYPFLIPPVFSGSGSGSPDDPYVVENLEQLDEVRDFRTAHFVLGRDIDAGESVNWNGGLGFLPIGPQGFLGYTFSGSFDGRGRKILNLYIRWELDTGMVGLFSAVDVNASISRLILENFELRTRSGNAGALAGVNLGQISSCSTSGRINADGSNAGGLVGVNRGLLRSCSFNGSVRGYSNAGGLCGQNLGEIHRSRSNAQVSGRTAIGALIGRNDNLVFNSFSAGGVTAEYQHAGGLIGLNMGTCSQSFSTASASGVREAGGLIGINYGLVANCYARGSVSGDNYVGGLVGTNEVQAPHYFGRIQKSYSTGAVSGSQPIGGLVGMNNGSVTDSFWDIETSGRNTSAGGTGKTTENMKNVRTYTDNTWSEGLTEPWDFVGNPYQDNGTEDIWAIASINDGYPVLSGLSIPVLLSPENGAAMRENLPYFSWTIVIDESENYRLRIWDNSTGLVVYDAWLTENFDNFAGHPENALPDGIYCWSVRIEQEKDNENTAGPWAENFWFRIDTIGPPPPSLISPADGASLSDNSPTLSWTAVQDNSMPVVYYVAISDNGEFPHENRSSGWITENSWKVAPELPDGLWYWRVRAKDNLGNIGEWSEIRSFRVDTVPPAAPTLISPENGENTNDNTPTLSWQSVIENSLPVLYYVAISDDPSFPHENENSGWIADNSWTAPELQDGVWYWRVKAMDNAGNEGAWSAVWTFRVDTVPPAIPAKLSPENGRRTKQHILPLVWQRSEDPQPGSGILCYEVWLSNQPDFSQVIALENVIGETYETPPLVNGTYYWRVRAWDASGNASGFEDPWSFTVDTMPPPVPTPSSPSNGSLLNSSSPSLSWSPVSKDSLQILYRVSVSRSPDFTDALDSGWIPQTSWRPPPLVDGTYYWRVMAVDEIGNESGWSETRSFTVDTTPPAPPSPVSPSDGQALGSRSVTLAWSRVDDASQPVAYTVSISSSPDFSLDLRNSGWILSTSFSLNLPEGIWFWRIVARDAAGNTGQWSTVRSFVVDTSPPETPEIFSPTHRENHPAPRSLAIFTWSRVGGPSPVTYSCRLDPIENGWRSTSENSFTYENLPDGLYVFRLFANDAGGRSDEVSYRIAVDTTPPGLETGHPENTPITSRSRRFLLTGRTEPGSIVEADNVSTVADKDGSFSLELSISGGTNIIHLRITDRAGNSSEHVLTVVLPEETPVWPLFLPAAAAAAFLTLRFLRPVRWKRPRPRHRGRRYR